MSAAARAPALLLASLLLISSGATAMPFGEVLDTHVGEINDGLQAANETYGEREEFQQARGSLARGSVALVHNATVLAQDSVMKAQAGLQTGIAEAEGGGAEQPLVDRGRDQADDARSTVESVRSTLDSIEDSGMEPTAFAGSLAVAHSVNRALDALDLHDTALEQWESGKERHEIARRVIAHGASAKLAANIAEDTLERVTEARENVSSTRLLTEDEIAGIAEDRVEWLEGNRSAVAKQSYDRVVRFDEADEHLMTLSAFAIHFQNVAFNGILKQGQQGQDSQSFKIAWSLYNESSPRIDAWADLLDVPAEISRASAESSRAVLVLNENASGDQRNRVGAFAVGLGHLGIEYASYLQEGFGHKTHTPGHHLKSAEIVETSDTSENSTPFPSVAIGLVALAGAALRSRRKD